MDGRSDENFSYQGSSLKEKDRSVLSMINAEQNKRFSFQGSS